ncbi:MAG: DMT family transporter [Bacteroidota bacterium]|nr:DMT family transporter [Bacteroidota bacterium]
MKQQTKAYLLALTAILFWSTMSSAFKITLRYTDPLNLLLFSSFFSIIVLFALLLMNGKIPLLKQTSLKDLRNSALLGLLNPFLYYVVLFRAYELLPAQEAGTLNYIWPVVLVLFSIPLLKQKIGWLSMLAIFISFLGIIIISTHGDVLSFQFTDRIGVILAVGSAVFWALFFLLNVRDKRDENVKIFWNISFGFLYILIFSMFFSEIQLPRKWGLLGALYIGAFEMGITFVIWLTALRLSKSTAKISNLVYLSPFIALFFIRFAVGEIILLSTIIGLVFVVSGIILQKYSK